MQRDREPSIFDELDDVGVRHADDGLSIDSQDPVAHLQLPAPVCRAALDDASNFMGHSWRHTVIRRMSAGIWKKDVKTAPIQPHYEVGGTTCFTS